MGISARHNLSQNSVISTYNLVRQAALYCYDDTSAHVAGSHGWLSERLSRGQSSASTPTGFKMCAAEHLPPPRWRWKFRNLLIPLAFMVFCGPEANYIFERGALKWLEAIVVPQTVPWSFRFWSVLSMRCVCAKRNIRNVWTFLGSRCRSVRVGCHSRFQHCSDAQSQWPRRGLLWMFWSGAYWEKLDT